MFDCCVMRSLSRRERRLFKSASADLIWYSTSTAACLSVGLESSTRTVPALPVSPGLTNFCSTRPSTGAAICRISSGMSVPKPRTLRSICPRLTVSVRTDERDGQHAQRRVDGQLHAPTCLPLGTLHVHRGARRVERRALHVPGGARHV